MLIPRKLIYLMLFLGFVPATTASGSTSVARGHETARPLIDWLHTSWTAREGAPPNITGIVQTPDGWIWVSSASSLYKFDGVRFLRVSGSEAPLSSYISTIGVLRDGRLWVGYAQGGISLLEGGKMRHLNSGQDNLPLPPTYDVALDASGLLWLGTQAGLYYFDTQWRPVAAAMGFPGGRVHSMLLDRSDVLWVRCEAGLFALPRGSRKFLQKSARTGLGKLVQHPDGSIWTNSDDLTGVVSVTIDGSGRLQKLNSVALITAFLFDHEGNLWTNAEGVKRFKVAEVDTAVQQTELEQGLSGSRVSALLQDREKNLWVVTEGGLDRFTEPRLRPLALPEYSVFGGRPIAGGPNGSAFVNGSLVASAAAKPQPIAPDYKKLTVNLYRAPDGTLWGGGDGFWTLDSTGIHELALPDGIPKPFVNAIAQDRAGDLWISLGRNGLYKWRAGHWSTPHGIDSKGRSVLSIKADALGRIWLGLIGGRVAVVDKDEVKWFDHQNGLNIGTVAQIVPTDSGVWFGGENGIRYFDGRRFVPLIGKGGELFTGSTGLAFGRDGTLWINGSAGISSVASTEVTRAMAGSGNAVSFRRLDYRDGVRGGTHPQIPIPSVATSDDGTLWFSNTGGVYAIGPGTLSFNTVIPPVLITRLRSGAKEFPLVDGSLISAGTDTLQLDFTALSYQAPERMEFRYRLEGVDREWRDSTGNRTANYTNLGPGHYTFRVVASNNDGVWNNQGATISFTIEPLPTQTWWFKLLCALAILAILAALYSWRTRRISRRYIELLQERIAERERIARALHDTLMQTMQAMLMRFGTATKRLPSEDSTRATMEELLDEASDAMTMARDEVHDLRAGPIQDGVNIEHALAQFGYSFQEQLKIQFKIKVVGNVRPLTAFAWQEISAVAREAMFNAFIHAHAKNIEVNIVYGLRRFKLSVCDDGTGIDETVLREGSRRGHWGLPGMRERAIVLGGCVTLLSSRERGTQVQLSVPHHSAYAKRETWSHYKT
ncbi:sensor histidine kinase [Duganella levis]|uniref:Histidine kinase/HSP90-like ATPase domain-containing protein n=1 Tax=Duganella levis TaxID=2692169 RepID=A0ABW9W438_9BURK|nr:hypothetical protein [Duganella levis]